MKIAIGPCIAPVLAVLLQSDALSQQLFEPWSSSGGDVTLPQVRGVAAWADMHGNSNEYIVGASNEYRQDLAVAGRDSAGNIVTAVYRAINNSPYYGDFAAPSADPGAVSHSQNLSPAVDGRSIAWCDYNNDGFPDLAVAGVTAEESGRVVLYKNQARAGAVEAPYRELVEDAVLTHELNLAQPGTSRLLWLDYDNDGKTDLLTSGIPHGQNIHVTRMFRNTGGRFVRDENADSNLPLAMEIHSMRAGDLDLDSDLDLLLSDSGGNVTVFANRGDGTFLHFAQPCRSDGELTASALSGKSAWLDLNSDHYPDLVMAGRTIGNSSQPTLRFSLNIPAVGGGRAFAIPENIADPIGSGGNPALMVELEVGDMDHDGTGDLVVAGYDANDVPAFRIYGPSTAPDGTLSVTADPRSASYQPREADSSPLDAGGLAAGGSWSNLCLGDFISSSIGVGRSSLDVLLLGTSNGTPTGRMLCNPNSADLDNPDVVLSLQTSMLPGGNIRFQWVPYAPEADKSRTHALRVRRLFDDPVDSHYDISPGSRSVSGHGFVEHLATLPQPGNMGGANFWDWKNHGLTPGDRLYVEVDSVNARYTISTNMSTTTFRVPFLAPVDGLPAETANTINWCGGSAWADIDGDGDTDGIVGGSAGVRLWMNTGDGNFVQAANPTDFGSSARYEWGDVNGDGLMDLLASMKGVGLTYNGGIFRNLGGIDGAVRFSAFEPFAGTCQDAKFADCDMDGDLDVAVFRIGSQPEILINQGPASVEEPLGERVWASKDVPSPALGGGNYYGSVSWADIDNDGRPDLLVSGFRSNLNSMAAFFFRNAGMLDDGGVDIQVVAAPDLPQVEAARPAWGDIDGDGYLDLFIAGRDYGQADEGDHAVLLNRPDGSGGRTLVRATAGAGFDGTRVTEEKTCEALWVDFNNDGWLDLAVTAGGSKSIYLSEMVNGIRTLVRAEPLSSGSFGDPSDPSAPLLAGDLPATSALGLSSLDADGDGRMDLLIGTSGGGNTGYAIYRNHFDVAPLQAPAQPEALTATFDPHNETLQLQWPASPRARYYNLLVKDLSGDAAALPLQSGPFPERWPVSGQSWMLSGFRPLLGSTYQIGVRSVDQNRQTSGLTTSQVSFPAALVGTVVYVPPAWPLLERRLASPAGLRVYADLDSDGAWDGEETEPSALTDANGAYRIPQSATGQIQVRIDGLCPTGGVLALPAPVEVAVDDGGQEIVVGDLEVTDAFELEVAVFYDRDRDGIRDAGEELLNDWPLTLDANNNGTIDAAEESHESGGIFTCLTDQALLAQGVQPTTGFVISRRAQAPPPLEWLVMRRDAAGTSEHAYQFPQGQPEVMTLDTPWHVRLPAVAGFRTTLEVGVWSTPKTVYGHVIHDQNSDGNWDVDHGEPGLDDWDVLLDFNNDGLLDPSTGEMIATTTGGSFVFHPVTPGRAYQVSVRKPDESWVRSFPSDEVVPVEVGSDNVTGVDFGFFQPGIGEQAPVDRADAMTDPDGNGAPKVFDFLFGRAVMGQPLQGLRLAGSSELLGMNPALPIRTDARYPVFHYRVRPSHAGISYSIHAATSLDGDPDKELAWFEISSSTTSDGMIEREVVVLPTLPTRTYPRLPDPQGLPPAKAFMRIHVDLSGLPAGPADQP